MKTILDTTFPGIRLTMAAGFFFTASAIQAGETISTAKTAAPVEIVNEKEAWITFSLTTGYDSLYEFRGVNLLGSRGIGYVDANTTLFGFNLGGWFAGDGGGGRGKGYSEIDLYASYTYDFGPVAVTGGYIYYKFPQAEPSADETQEFYASISSSAIPYLTPTLAYYYDFDLYEGGYLEFKIASSFPIYKDIVSVEPYVLVSYDFKYNSEQDGFNSFQAGLNIPIHINKFVTLSGYISMATPLDVLSETQETEVWAGGKINFSF